jgi:putative PIN family toxin of toxin-antitoxin system
MHELTNPPLRLVLDTQVWLDLLVFMDARCGPLANALAQGQALAIVRPDTVEEWERVLHYPALKLDAARIASTRVRYFDLASLHQDQPAAETAALPRCRDPDDQKFLQLAAHAGAHALVSRDRALLELNGKLKRAGLFSVIEPTRIGALLGQQRA